MIENEHDDPVGDLGALLEEPIARFTQGAFDVGLIRLGDKLDQNVIDLCMRVVDMAAAIGDRYPNPEVSEDSVGEDIRGQLDR